MIHISVEHRMLKDVLKNKSKFDDTLNHVAGLGLSPEVHFDTREDGLS